MLMPEGNAASGAIVIRGACAATGGQGNLWPGLQPRTKSGSVVQLQLESVLMYMARVSTKGQMDACGLDHHGGHVDVQGPCFCWGYPDLSDLHCRLSPWCCSGLTCG